MTALKRQHDNISGSGSWWRVVVLIAAVIILISGLFKFIPSLLSGRFGRFERFNLVVDVGSGVALVSLLTNGKGAAVVNIPEELYVSEVAHGYGQYRVSKIYQVGQLDKRGGEVLSDTLSDLIGVPVEGYVKSAVKTGSVKAHLSSLDFVLRDKSNLNIWERITIFRAISGMRFDRIKETDLRGQAEKATLTDFSSALMIDKAQIDRTLAGDFVEEGLEKENARIVVVNSTEVAGLGSRAARLMENIGIPVVSVDSDPILRKGCVITTTEKMKQSLTVRRIGAIFNCTVETTDEKERGDAQVYVGQNYADLMLK